MAQQGHVERAAGTRQIGGGAALLVVGAVITFLLVQAGANTFAAAGYIVLVAGAILVGNGLVLQRKAKKLQQQG